jgi:hypothetical protein
MGIQNLNGTARKNARRITGSIHSNVAGEQHGTVSFSGTTYNSPFTSSGKPLFTPTNDNGQQVQLAPLKVEAPGDVVGLHEFVKVHPQSKTTLNNSTRVIPVVTRAGGPSKHHDTPSSPNKQHPQPRKPRSFSKMPVEKTSNLSFLRSGGTLSSHAGKDQYASRWSKVKKGVVS